MNTTFAATERIKDKPMKNKSNIFLLVTLLIVSVFVLATLVGARATAQEPVETPKPKVVIRTIRKPIFIVVERPVAADTEETTETDDAEETETHAYSEDDLEMLAAVIYQEAGSNRICDECRYRVGDVILNRVADPRFPDTIKGVLEQPGQYGTFSVTGVVWPEKAKHDTEKEAVARAYETARQLLSDERHSDLYGQGYIWQAEFVQGTDGFWCDGTYFGR